MKLLQQLKLGDKVKLKLEQPKIKCSGRSEVNCFYRGKIIETYENSYNVVISFKYKGKLLEKTYNKFSGFEEEELKDIKII